MRVGKRGRVLPKELRKVPAKLNLEKWKGHGADSLSKLGYSSVDQFIEDIRGR